MTIETLPIPNGIRATTEAIASGATWGAETTRAHGPRPLSGLVDSEYKVQLRGGCAQAMASVWPTA
jgi:hypothetical protein